MSPAALRDVAVVLQPADDVAIAKAELSAGAVLEDDGGPLTVRADIAPATRWPGGRSPRASRSAATAR